MVKRESKRGGGKSKGGLCALIVHENPSLREAASRFWQDIEKQSPTGQKPEAKWWSFEQLDHPTETSKAAERAARADLIVFSLSASGDLPAGVQTWIESWLGQRHEREGALVGLVEGKQEFGGTACLKEIYLRRIAHRAGMDYVSQIPALGSKPIPDSLDSFSQRAGQVTSVLDEILRNYPLPPPIP